MRRLAVTVLIAFSLLAGVSTARAEMDVIVNKSTQQMSVVIDGSVRYIWNISTGLDAYSAPNGTFVPEHLERSWFSRRYYNSPMPYAIFFHNGYAMKVEFGPAANNAIPGKIFICLPDDSQSWIAGNFRAEIHKPKPPKPVAQPQTQ